MKYTADNLPCRDVYEKVGFELVEESADQRLFRLRPDVALEIPAHITLGAGSPA